MVLDLKGMNGVPPKSSTSSMFGRPRYALSTATSLTAKCYAVALTRGLKNQLSWTVWPDMSTPVTTLVLTPTIRCALNHSRFSFSTPYLRSNQRPNVLVEKPEEPTAKSVSTALNGKLLAVTSFSRTPVRAGSER